MPFVGPEKGAIIQQLVRELQPNLVVEVGSLCGYSAITLAQALPQSARLITIEKDFLWTLAARRFIYQAGVGTACALHCNSGNMDFFVAGRQDGAAHGLHGTSGYLDLHGAPLSSICLMQHYACHAAASCENAASHCCRLLLGLGIKAGLWLRWTSGGVMHCSCCQRCQAG